MPLTQAQIEAVAAIIAERRRKEAEEANKGGLARKVLPTALRVVGGVGGALAGTAIAPGPGTIAGGGGGAALGELAAQGLETMWGDRESISPTGVAIEGAIGAIPLAKTATLARAAGQGAMLAGGQHVAHKVLEEGKAPGLETIPVAGLGALFGAGAHKVFGALGNRLSARAGKAATEAVDPLEEQAVRYTDLAGDVRPHTLADLVNLRTTPQVKMRQGLPDLAEEVAAPPAAPPTIREGAGFPDEILGETALARRQAYDLTKPLDLAPPVQYVPPRPTPLLPGRTRTGSALNPPVNELPAGTIPRELPTSVSPAEAVATDVVGSPRRGLTGLFASQNERLGGGASSVAPDASDFGAGVRSSGGEKVAGAAKAQAGGAETASPAESALLQFLKGQGKGATMTQLVSKFGPGISKVIEKLAKSGQVSRGKGIAGKYRANAGFIGNEAQQALGGAVLGGAVGATQGETPEERVTYGLLGAGAGAAGGAQLAKFLERRRLGPNPSKVAEAVLGPTSATEAAGPVIPAAARVSTDKKIRVVGGRTLNAAQGEVPVAQITEPQGPIPGFQSQPKARYEQGGFNPNIFRPELRDPIKQYVLDDALRAEADQMRRGRISVAAAAERAKRYTVALDKPWKPGTTVLPEELLAVGRLEQGLYAQGAEQAARFRTTGNDQDFMSALKSFQQGRVLYLDRVGATAEAGRTLRYAQELDKLMNQGQRLVREAQKQGRLTKVMGEFEDLMRNVPEDPTEAAKFLSKHMDAGTFDKITSYYMANILSAIPSYIRNGIGSAVNSVGRVAIKGALAGPMDALISKLTGRQRAIYSTEVLHEIAGANFAAREGLADAWTTLKNGFSARGITEGIQFGELHVPKVEFAGGLANPWNQPGRILEATDRFFQVFNQGMSKNGLMWARAQREADAQGLVGKAFDDFMQQRMSQLAADEFIQGQAVQTGRRTAFREDPGKIANALVGMKKHAPILNYIIPFVTTVSNIFRQGIEHSPFAPILSRTRQAMFPDLAGLSADEVWMAHREQSEAFAKWAFGLASTVPIAVWAGTGKISGSGPSDPAKRAALYEQGWRPNSIQIGDKWYNYSTWQPLSIPMALVANAFESYEDSVDSFSKEGKEVDWEKVASATAFKVLNSATQQSYLQGVMALSAAMEDPDQFAENFLRQMAQGFYPMSGLQRTIARGIDPNIRENKTVQESLQRITPGLSESLPSRLNRWGEDVTYSGGPLWRMIGGPVFGGEGGKRDPINDELQRLGVDVGLPTERIVMDGKRVELPRAQGHEMRRVKGQLVRDALERVILSAGYAELPDEIKRERVEDALSRVSRSNARRIRVGLQSNPSDFLSLLRERAANRE